MQPHICKYQYQVMSDPLERILGRGNVMPKSNKNSVLNPSKQAKPIEPASISPIPKLQKRIVRATPCFSCGQKANRFKQAIRVSKDDDSTESE